MANTDNPNGFQYLRTRDGSDPVLEEVLITDELAVTKGDALYFASGYLTNATVAEASIKYVAAESCEASEDGVNPKILAYPATKDIIFEAQCSGTFAEASHLGTAVQIEGATGEQEVDENASTTDQFFIEKLSPESETGLNARVQGHFVTY